MLGSLAACPRSQGRRHSFGVLATRLSSEPRPVAHRVPRHVRRPARATATRAVTAVEAPRTKQRERNQRQNDVPTHPDEFISSALVPSTWRATTRRHFRCPGKRPILAGVAVEPPEDLSSPKRFFPLDDDSERPPRRWIRWLVAGGLVSAIVAVTVLWALRGPAEQANESIKRPPPPIPSGECALDRGLGLTAFGATTSEWTEAHTAAFNPVYAPSSRWNP